MRNSGRGVLLACLLAVVLVAYSAYGLSAKPYGAIFTQNTSANYANSNFSVNWTANTSADNISNYSIYVFNSGSFFLKADNTSATGYFFNATANNGNYTFNITAVNTTGEESENLTSEWIFADFENATITLNSPANGLNTTNSSAAFNFTAADNTALNCSLYIDGALNQTNASIANNTATIFSAALPEGRHFWNISCRDSANNTNASMAYNIGIDSSAPVIILGSPANSAWDNDGMTNFTFTATDAVTKIDNCSLWTNTTGTWALNLTNSSVSNSTQGTFVFNDALGSGTYKWNVECFDNLTNSNFSSQNYTFTVGNATDFRVTSVMLANSTNGNNPIPGSNLTINATIENAGTINSAVNITVALFLETAFLANYTISNDTLTSNNSTNITFTILGAGNITGYGSHNIKIAVDYRDLISEQNETNNNMTLVLLSGLNASANTSIGSAVQTPKPGNNVSVSLAIKYQNGSAVAGLISANVTIYDVYTYENGTTAYNRNLAINYFNDSQNASGIYFFNATSPAKTSANRAEYGTHYIRISVRNNESVAYFGEDNRTSNYYIMQAPNLELRFNPADAYHLDFAYHTTEAFTLQIKNNGTANITGIIVAVSTNGSSTLTNNSINYSASALCNLDNITISNTFTTIPSCSIIFNTTTAGSYNLTAIAGGIDPGNNAAYNSTRATHLMLVDNSTAATSASSSSSTGTVRVNTYNYTINFTNYTKQVLLEQGDRKNITFSIKNIGNGTINNLSVKLISPESISWGLWYHSTNASKLAPKETAHIITNMAVPLNATVATYIITASAAGYESGSSKTAAFVLQVIPGTDTKKQINISFDRIEAEIANINSTLLKLLQNADNENLTIASKRLSEIEKLRLEAEQAILKGDYLTAYNNKQEIDAMIPIIKQLLNVETQAAETKKGRQMSMFTIAAILIAIAALGYYLWLPEEGYVPGKGFFPSRSNSSIVRRAKEILNRAIYKPAKDSSEIVHEMMEKDRQAVKYAKPKEQPYNYSHKGAGPKFGAESMFKNLVDQFKEHGKTNAKPNYNYHKKQRWSND